MLTLKDTSALAAVLLLLQHLPELLLVLPWPLVVPVTCLPSAWWHQQEELLLYWAAAACLLLVHPLLIEPVRQQLPPPGPHVQHPCWQGPLGPAVLLLAAQQQPPAVQLPLPWLC